MQSSDFNPNVNSETPSESFVFFPPTPKLTYRSTLDTGTFLSGGLPNKQAISLATARLFHVRLLFRGFRSGLLF